MTDKKRGLGRGLGALIPNAPAPGNAGSTVVADALLTPSTGSDSDISIVHSDGALAHYADIPIDEITPNPRQPRQVFDEESLDELVFSLKEVGLLQPIVVRPATGSGSAAERAAGHGPKYELVAGERRWRAAQKAEFATIPAIIRETGDDVLLRDALLENLHRAQLNPLEEAAAYGQLLSDFGCTQEELALRIGRSRPQVSNTLRLLRLPPSVQRRVAAGVLSAGHARALLALDDAKDQEKLASRIVSEGLSVRTVEELVALGDVGDGLNGDDKSPRKRSKAAQNPALADLAAALSDDLETRVTVDLGRTKGKITITFASVDDLERIVGAIAPQAANALRGAS